MMVVHTVPTLDPSYGGPARSVPALVDALRAHGVGATVHAWGDRRNRPSTEDFVDAWILHDHGIWRPTNHRLATIARRWGMARLVSVRGMLEPWAINHHRTRKRLAWVLYQAQDLRGADALHVTSKAEAASVRRLGLENPLILVSNGVDIPTDLPPRMRGSRRRALFLSRIHPKKGLPMLLRAWSRVRPQNWELMIAGPDEGDHRSDLEGIIARLGLRDDVTFTGPVPDSAKWELYRRADLFVLPTHSENFGLVVAEALGCGMAVITTRGAPWRELETQRCGWWTDVSVDAIAAALAEATALTREERDEMGERGRRLVLERYSWSQAAAAMRDAYTWVLTGSDPDSAPACVRLTD